MSGKPTFKTAHKCNECYEESGWDEDDWTAKHTERHRLGVCAKCGHWRDGHVPADDREREYLRTDQKLVCRKNLGMGDFCGCEGETQP